MHAAKILCGCSADRIKCRIPEEVTYLRLNGGCKKYGIKAIPGKQKYFTNLTDDTKVNSHLDLNLDIFSMVIVWLRLEL